jgi:hypothetical protein
MVDQIDQDISNVLQRMGQLLSEHTTSFPRQVDYGIYGKGVEYHRKWNSPKAEQTYKTYVRILADLHRRKNGK